MAAYDIEKNRFALRMLYFCLGLLGAALGITLIFAGRLGVDPNNVLVDGLSKTFGLSIGFWITILWLSFIVTAVLLGLKPYIATVLDLAFFGLLVDLLMRLLALPEAGNILGALLYTLSGMLILAFSVGVYVNAQLGAGPTMLFTMAVARKSGRSIGFVKTVSDLLMLGIGFALGGTVGIGTLILALCVGYLFQFFIQHIRLPGLLKHS